jgi:hypothetical protein
MSTKIFQRGSRIAVSCALVIGVGYLVLGATASENGFPEGYDAVKAAPNSHRVVFENSIVRVLEVTIPPAGESEPMHHHRWPSFFVDWDIGGKTNHLRYHRPDGSVRDIPAVDTPKHPGRWRVRWLEPEPMHAIETIEKNNDATDLRVEIKVGS